MSKITHLKVFSDNYIWIILSDDERYATIIDPGEAKIVIKFLEELSCKLEAIIITHYDADHVGGVEDLTKKYSCKVYGHSTNAPSYVTNKLNDGAIIKCAKTKVELEALATPGHTPNHMCYYAKKMKLLFSGDALFVCGCGRLNNGLAIEMFESINRLATLPDDTTILPGHEYAINNVRFALTIDGKNDLLKEYLDQLKNKYYHAHLPIKSTIDMEKLTNPFMRCSKMSFQKIIERWSRIHIKDALHAFTIVRQRKDAW